VIDVDATLVTAHPEKEAAAPTFKRGFGFHPLWAFVDHGSEGIGEPLAFGLRAGTGRRLLHLAAASPFTVLALQALDGLARLTRPAVPPAPGGLPAHRPDARSDARTVEPAPTRATQASRHTRMRFSCLRGTRTPTTIGTIMTVKDPG